LKKNIGTLIGWVKGEILRRKDMSTGAIGQALLTLNQSISEAKGKTGTISLSNLQTLMVKALGKEGEKLQGSSFTDVLTKVVNNIRQAVKEVSAEDAKKLVDLSSTLQQLGVDALPRADRVTLIRAQELLQVKAGTLDKARSRCSIAFKEWQKTMKNWREGLSFGKMRQQERAKALNDLAAGEAAITRFYNDIDRKKNLEGVLTQQDDRLDLDKMLGDHEAKCKEFIEKFKSDIPKYVGKTREEFSKVLDDTMKALKEEFKIGIKELPSTPTPSSAVVPPPPTLAPQLTPAQGQQPPPPSSTTAPSAPSTTTTTSSTSSSAAPSGTVALFPSTNKDQLTTALVPISQLASTPTAKVNFALNVDPNGKIIQLGFYMGPQNPVIIDLTTMNLDQGALRSKSEVELREFFLNLIKRTSTRQEDRTQIAKFVGERGVTAHMLVGAENNLQALEAAVPADDRFEEVPEEQPKEPAAPTQQQVVKKSGYPQGKEDQYIKLRNHLSTAYESRGVRQAASFAEFVGNLDKNWNKDYNLEMLNFLKQECETKDKAQAMLDLFTRHSNKGNVKEDFGITRGMGNIMNLSKNAASFMKAYMKAKGWLQE
jgi:hypothetical protein